MSFWVPPASIPGRTALLITTYLVLTNMSSAAMSFNAPVFTAMDVWFYACKMIVVAAIFEFAAILKILNSSKGSFTNDIHKIFFSCGASALSKL